MKKTDPNRLPFRRKYNINDVWQSYIFLALPIIGFFVLSLYPISWAARWSFYDFMGAARDAVFIGLANFKTVFRDVTYWSTWVTTFQFAVLKLPVELPLAMILAVFLNREMKGRGIFRAVYFMPAIISAAIIGLIFSNMFEYFGVINALLMKSGIIDEGINWFNSKFTALVVLALADTWRTFGTNVLYFLSALQNVDESIYEAATIDGAGKLTLFFKFTLPLIAPVLQTILLLSINGTLHTGDFIIATTNGAPGGQTHTVMSYLTRTFMPGFASNYPPIGYGCALGIITAILMASIALIYNKLSSKLANMY